MKSFKQFINEAADSKNNDNFWKWFGDSKVVDGNGEPMVVYHGSPTKGINIFTHDGPKHTGDDTLGKGFYFTSSKSFAARYAHHRVSGEFGDIYPVYLRIENPYLVGYGEHEDIVAELFGRFPEMLSVDEKTQKLIDAGFDGIISQNNGVDVIEGYGVDEMDADLVVFSSNQIKAADRNNGNFDPNDPDITH